MVTVIIVRGLESTINNFNVKGNIHKVKLVYCNIEASITMVNNSLHCKLLKIYHAIIVCGNLEEDATVDNVFISYYQATNINIAFEKPTQQYPDTYCEDQGRCHNSSLAVNGITNPDVSSGNCSHTTSSLYTKIAWWSVNFEDFYHLSSIQIYNRGKHTIYFKCVFRCDCLFLYYYNYIHIIHSDWFVGKL